MNKIISAVTLVVLLAFISGCSTYKFHKGNKLYSDGYIASVNDYDIIEFTVGKDNSVPSDLELAKKRFERRRDIVEDYYKRMGYIESKLKQAFLDYPIIIVKAFGGIFCLPYIFITDYKYEHNREYRQRVDRLNQEAEDLEKARIKALKSKLNAYIRQDLSKEGAK